MKLKITFRLNLAWSTIIDESNRLAKITPSAEKKISSKVFDKNFILVTLKMEGLCTYVKDKVNKSRHMLNKRIEQVFS